MTREIEFYYDFISPYSYIAHKRIAEIENSNEVKFVYKPILLGGLHKLAKITAPGLIESKKNYLVQDCKNVSAKYKINFKFNDKFPINSLYLMRGNLIIPENKLKIYVQKCFEAYWLKNIDILKTDNVKIILNECEIDENTFLTDIEKMETKEKLKKLTQKAFEKKIFGAPTFVANNKIFWGQDRLDYAIDETKNK